MRQSWVGLRIASAIVRASCSARPASSQRRAAHAVSPASRHALTRFLRARRARPVRRSAGGRRAASERETFAAVQRQGMRWTYLGSGMTHPKFAGSLGELLPAGAERVGKMAEALC